MGFISGLYEWKLKKAIEKQDCPENIVLALTESDLLSEAGSDKLKYFISWCDEYRVNTVIVYISIIEVDSRISRSICEKLSGDIPVGLSSITNNINVITRGEKKLRTQEKEGMRVDISVGFSGKYELITAIKEIMEEVKNNRIAPEDIDENVIESHLLFKSEPDLVIRAGGRRLTDFLIWQSVYSELYFTDVNWLDFQKVDFLRVLRDFQKRQRRFGK